MKGLFQNKIQTNLNDLNISEKDRSIDIFQQDFQFYLIIQEYKDVLEDFSEVISISSDLDKKEISEVKRK